MTENQGCSFVMLYQSFLSSFFCVVRGGLEAASFHLYQLWVAILGQDEG